MNEPTFFFLIHTSVLLTRPTQLFICAHIGPGLYLVHTDTPLQTDRHHTDILTHRYTDTFTYRQTSHGHSYTQIHRHLYTQIDITRTPVHTDTRTHLYKQIHATHTHTYTHTDMIHWYIYIKYVRSVLQIKPLQHSKGIRSKRKIKT